MERKPFYIGHNINISSGLASSSDYAKTLGANFYQIFLTNPQKYQLGKHSNLRLELLKSKLEANNQKIVVHGSFMTNFCNPPDNYKHIKAVELVVNDMINAEKIGALGVIIHMGKKLKMEENEAFDNYIKGIKKVLSSTKSGTLILETGAGVGTEICSDTLDLRKIYNKLTKEERNRVKYCIDTCHIFSAGTNINDLEYCKIYCKMITKFLGWKNIACLHLNDSKCGYNSRKDRHADIGKGNIDVEGLKYLVKACYDNDVPVVLETPCDELSKKEQIDIVKSWIYI